MTDTWGLVYNLFINNVPLVAALSHTAGTPKIFRSYQYKNILDNDHILVFNTEDFMPTIATADLRNVLLFTTVISKIDDTNVENINEIIMDDLNNKKLTDANLYTHGEMLWDGFKTPPEFDNDDKRWASDMRFKFTVSKK